MGKKRKNIIGLTFKCEDCNQVFAIGKKGVDAALGRVQKHMEDNHHMSIPPVNPPKGLVYKSEVGDVRVVYDGGDVNAFIEAVKAGVYEARCTMVPQLKLA